MYALKRGIEAVFQLEDNELAVEPLPGRTGDHAWSRLLFIEAAEGGAGVLRRLATEDGQLRRGGPEGAWSCCTSTPTPARTGTGPSTPREDCAQACYDCLLSYANQWDHQHLDRHRVTGLLQRLARATVAVRRRRRGPRRAAGAARRQASNSLERRFLDLLDDHGYRLPDEAQQLVDGYYVRPDFAYHTGGMDVAVFIDGPVHDSGHQQDKDEQAADEARATRPAGWCCGSTTSDADDGWHRRVHRAHNADVFGPRKVGRMTVDRRSAAGTLVRARGREWVVLPGAPDRDCCWSGRSAAATTKPPCCCPTSMRRARPCSTRPASTTSATPRRARLLRDALRLSFRATAGPFRSFASHRVSPRNYQLVPLLMALPPGHHPAADRRRRRHRQDHRGRADRRRAARHRARRSGWRCCARRSWRRSGRPSCAHKFGIDAELLLPSTVNRLSADGAVAGRPSTSTTRTWSSPPTSSSNAAAATSSRCTARSW